MNATNHATNQPSKHFRLSLLLLNSYFHKLTQLRDYNKFSGAKASRSRQNIHKKNQKRLILCREKRLRMNLRLDENIIIMHVDAAASDSSFTFWNINLLQMFSIFDSTLNADELDRN